MNSSTRLAILRRSVASVTRWVCKPNEENLFRIYLSYRATGTESVQTLRYIVRKHLQTEQPMLRVKRRCCCADLVTARIQEESLVAHDIIEAIVTLQLCSSYVGVGNYHILRCSTCFSLPSLNGVGYKEH